MYGNHKDSGLAGRSFVITAGASGIGRSVAPLLADAEALMTFGNLNEAGMAEAAQLVGEFSDTIGTVRTDVSYENDIEGLLRTAIAMCGEIDGAANIAPSGRIAHPGEIACAVRSPHSPEASFVNSACLRVDGG